MNAKIARRKTARKGGDKGEWRFEVRKNGRLIVASEWYAKRSGALRCAAILDAATVGFFQVADDGEPAPEQ